VAVLDSQVFPREKPCGGWLSPGVWDALELQPSEYPRSRWSFGRCHVQHRQRCHSVPGTGYFVRRYEFDDFLLHRSGAEVIQHTVKSLVRRDGAWQIDAAFEAPVVIGAAGTHCPLARAFLKPRHGLVAAQECEFVAGAEAVAASRVGSDGEPELLLHDDWGGYSWNVPKGQWLNVGSGTSEPKEVRAAWSAAREFFLGSGHVPAGASTALASPRGHSYHLFHPAHLRGCEQDGLLIAGDALGLAHPLTAEGILPAVISGRLAAEAVLSGESYRLALERHPVIRDYALAHGLLALALGLKGKKSTSAARVVSRAGLGPRWEAAAARGFGRLFSGRPIPGSNLLGAALLRTVELAKERS
jgi:flavin-dependent dehydrogenase